MRQTFMAEYNPSEDGLTERINQKKKENNVMQYYNAILQCRLIPTGSREFRTYCLVIMIPLIPLLKNVLLVLSMVLIQIFHRF